MHNPKSNFLNVQGRYVQMFFWLLCCVFIAWMIFSWSACQMLAQSLQPSHVALTTSNVNDAYIETDQESYIRTDDDEDVGNTDWEETRRRWINRWLMIDTASVSDCRVGGGGGQCLFDWLYGLHMSGASVIPRGQQNGSSPFSHLSHPTKG